MITANEQVDPVKKKKKNYHQDEIQISRPFKRTFLKDKVAKC